jgi:hypothetical protein
MSAVMGRPYQIHEAKPLLIPLHPMSLPFDLGAVFDLSLDHLFPNFSFTFSGIIAHQELQSIIGQVMDTFRDRIYGLSSASDEMPSPVVLKVSEALSFQPCDNADAELNHQLFNSRMDEWRQRWCPVAGEPIANNLLFYFCTYSLYIPVNLTNILEYNKQTPRSFS